MKVKKQRGARGSILIIVMILLVVLTFAASTSIMNSVTNIKIGSNYSETIGVFNLAELGIAQGKLILKNTASFSDLLAAYDPSSSPNGTVLIPTATEPDGKYTVYIKNNIEGAHPDSGGMPTDTDNIVILTSTAYGNKGNKVEIETYIGRPTSISFPTAPPAPGSGGGAVGVCGENPNVKAWGSGNIHGEEYDINGNKIIPVTGTYGVVMENPGTILEKKAGSITGFLGDDTVDPTLPCDEWKNLSSQLASLGPGPNVEIVTVDQISGGTYGTEANPKITIINTSSNQFKIAGNMSGAGVLIVASNADLLITGNMSYKGIIIIMGDDGAFKATGSMEHLGYVILNNSVADADYEIEMTGNGMMKFSPAAMGLAVAAIDGVSGGGGGGSGSQLITYSWAERY